MGNFIKSNPVGVQKHVQNLQTALYNWGKVEWNLSDSDWNSYGVIYRNFSNDGKEYLPYPFDNLNEYINPPLFEDNIKINSFFDILETQKIDDAGQSTMRVVLYMFCDLVKLFPNEYDRFDEQMSKSVASFVASTFGFQLHSKRIGIKTIMKDWSGFSSESTKSQNMQPLYAFSLEFEINEYYTCYVTEWTQNPVPIIPFTRYNPVGIDFWIQKFQVDLYNFVLAIFNGERSGMNALEPTDYNCFGRVYRNWSKPEGEREKYIPQAFVKVLQRSFEYVNVFFQDDVAIQSFFDVGETMREEESLMCTTDVHLYFFVNLNLLYEEVGFRMDEEFIILISQFVLECSGFNLHSIQRGIKAITNQFSGEIMSRIKKANMQPFLCFRMDMTKYYDESVEFCNSLVPSGYGGNQFNPQEFDPNQFA